MAQTNKNAPRSTAKRGSSAAQGGRSNKINVAKKQAVTEREPHPELASCVFGGVLAFAGMLTLIALLAQSGRLPGAEDALLVKGFLQLLRGLVGKGWYLAAPALLWAGVLLILGRDEPREKRVVFRAVSALLLPILLGTFVHMLAFENAEDIANDLFSSEPAELLRQLWQKGNSGEWSCGGVLAGLLGRGLVQSISIYGGVAVVTVGFALFLLQTLNLTARRLAEKSERRREESKAARDKDNETYFGQPEKLREEKSAAKKSGRKPLRTSWDFGDDNFDDDDYNITLTFPADLDDEPLSIFPSKTKAEKGENTQTPRKEAAGATRARKAAGESAPAVSVRRGAPPKPEPDPLADELFAESRARSSRREKTAEKRRAAPRPTGTARHVSAPAEPVSEPAEDALFSAPAASPSAPEPEEEPVSPELVAAAAAATKKLTRDEVNRETARVAAAVQARESLEAETRPTYEFPPLTLLTKGGSDVSDSRTDIEEKRLLLEEAVTSFGVDAVVVNETHGPTVTRYEMELGKGVKFNKISGLANDIAMSLGVSSVLIAPVPNKISTVGVEVPNRHVNTVWLRSVLDSDKFRDAKSRLSFALGKDIAGNVIVGNISKLPHLLIAGTTGSGKSVFVNTLIISLLYKSTPDELRMILIDPKMVELGVYNGMPHLHIPVVTDAKKAAGALQWAVVEMTKRYQLFADAGVRELATYNEYQRHNGEKTLPAEVIIIDELADLMMVAGKDVETSICRIAQMGRAAGMHLVVATQRPSVDVITGLMKANIPSRIAFAVSGAIDSRIILDTTGAEKLLGNGDMLYSPIGVGKPMRVQGAFVTDEEREKIINHVKSHGNAEYSDEILAEIERNASKNDKSRPDDAAADGDSSAYDELLPDAVEVLFETKQASVSMLQRRLKLGYARAARIVDQMEELHVVGPYAGSKPREILITKEQWQEMQLAQGTAPVGAVVTEDTLNGEDELL